MIGSIFNILVKGLKGIYAVPLLPQLVLCLLGVNCIRNSAFGEYLGGLVNANFSESKKEDYETEFKLENIGTSESDHLKPGKYGGL